MKRAIVSGVPSRREKKRTPDRRLPRVVPWFPLPGLTPSGLFMDSISTWIYTSELILCFTIYAIKHTTKIKAIFSYCDQIKFNELVLKPVTPVYQDIANQWMLTSSSWKPSCYLSKITLKSTCKHAPADDVVRAQKRKCLTYRGGDWKKTSTVKFSKRINNFKKTRGYIYILCYEMEVANLFNVWLVSGCEQKVFRLYFSRTKGSVSETIKAISQRLCYQKRTKNDFHVTICHVV